MTEYCQMKKILQQAKLGSFLLIPLKYEPQTLNRTWLEQTGTELAIDTVDINESVKRTIRAQNGLVRRYRIDDREVARHLLGMDRADDLYACPAGSHRQGEREQFALLDAEIWVFHTMVAFLCVKLTFRSMSLLDTICSLGTAENAVDYRYRDEQGQLQPFDLEAGLRALCRQAGLTPFFSEESRLLLESCTYTTALVSERFRDLETIRQATFNLHLMVDLENPVEDGSEEDVNFVYAVKNHDLGTYRWGCCVTTQTTSYIVADPDMDLHRELEEQASNGLPILMLALYQKYTCLRFKELVSAAGEKKSRRLRQLKKQLLEFQAYGTIPESNISRWHNVRRIYAHILDTNGIGTAIEDISTTLTLLTEWQKEIDTAKSDAIMGLITIFSVVSIPTSIIGLMDVLAGGSSINIITTVITIVAIALVCTVIALYKDRT